LQVMLHPWATLEDLLEDLRSVGEGPKREAAYALVVGLNVLLVLLKFALPKDLQLWAGLMLVAYSTFNTWRFLTASRRYQVFERASDYRGSGGTRSGGSAVNAWEAGGDAIVGSRDVHVWDPSAFAQIVFSYFSPLQVGIVLAGDYHDTRALVFSFCMAVLTCVVIVHLCDKYAGLLRDTKLIYNEVYREVDRFMLSRVAHPMAEAAIQAGIDVQEPSILYSPFSPSVTAIPGGSPRRITPIKKKHRNPFQMDAE